MSFNYKGFRIERQDENNILLLELRDVEIKVKGIPTGGTTKKYVLVGYYTSFIGALKELCSRLAEGATSPTELLDIVTKWEELLGKFK